MIIPVITLKEPYATLIMEGVKGIESRTHDRFKNLAGKIVGIHAGKSFDDSETLYQHVPEKFQPCSNPTFSNGYLLGYVQFGDYIRLNKDHNLQALVDCEHTQRNGLFVKRVMNKFYKMPGYYINGEVGIWYFCLDTMKKIRKSEIQNQKTLF